MQDTIILRRWFVSCPSLVFLMQHIAAMLENKKSYKDFLLDGIGCHRTMLSLCILSNFPFISSYSLLECIALELGQSEA
ncbi:hypothetical protein Csa_010644 [Cucumis sativus]|uniref:Uncharacterized protein n=1 Tax=Cucumis sativus TaxID=3659 RepID=A0A0A0L9H7_CUCSA|nr:hypothetical protein Csa_010644 [Cucumis sativus]